MVHEEDRASRQPHRKKTSLSGKKTKEKKNHRSNLPANPGRARSENDNTYLSLSFASLRLVCTYANACTLQLLLAPPRIRSRWTITRMILDPSVLERSVDRRQRSPERGARDDGDGGQNHRRRYRAAAGAADRGPGVAAARHLAAHQLASLDRVLVAVGVDRRTDVVILAQHHRQLVPQRLLRAGHGHLLVRPENARIVHLEVIRAGQGALAAAAQRLERAAASGFLKTLEVHRPVVAHQSFLQSHAR